MKIHLQSLCKWVYINLRREVFAPNRTFDFLAIAQERKNQKQEFCVGKDLVSWHVIIQSPSSDQPIHFSGHKLVKKRLISGRWWQATTQGGRIGGGGESGVQTFTKMTF